MSRAGSREGWGALLTGEAVGASGADVAGAFSAKGILPLEFKPAHSVGDLLTQHLGEVEQEAERKGGVMQALHDHFAKAYKVAMPHGLSMVA
jgi:hypothetical protein